MRSNDERRDLTAVPPPVPPEIVEKAAKLRSTTPTPARVSSTAARPPSDRAAETVLAAVYGDIVEAARRDALTAAIDAVEALDPDDDGNGWGAGIDAAVETLADLRDATAPRDAPSATVGDDGAESGSTSVRDLPGPQIAAEGWAELAEQATPGPWAMTRRGIEAGYDDVLVGGQVECMEYCYGGASTIEGDRLDVDAEFIAAARDAVPRLLALVAAQAEQIAEMRDGMFGWRKHCYDAWAERDASEAKIARVRALCDEAERLAGDRTVGVVGSGDIRAALDGTEGCSHHGWHVCPGEATP
jgi:hypothetical protein